MFIDSSLSRGLAKKHLSDWKDQGLLLRKQLSMIVFDAQQALKKGRSPAKAIGHAQSQLKKFFLHNSVAGIFGENHGRELTFSLTCPEPNDDGIVFLNIVGSMNARTGGIETKVNRTVAISLHALERLHQRIGTVDPSDVLAEIHSVVKLSKTFTTQGSRLSADCWPLISERGIFVATSAPDGATSTLITWMPFEKLSKKWGVVAVQLQEAKNKNPNLFADDEFCAEFIKSFPWMLHPHRPGVDTELVAWDSIGQDNANPTYIDIEDMESASANEVESNGESSNAQENGDDIGPRSIDLVPGFNYFPDPPPFKLHSRFTGIVVQSKLRSGSLIVSLLNGWVGHIPRQGLERANAVVDGLGEIEIGDRVVVEVMKIRRIDEGSAWAVSLDLAAKADLDWSDIEVRNPVNSLVHGSVVRLSNRAYYLRLTDGSSAELSKDELTWTNDTKVVESTVVIGHALTCVVTGSRPDRRVLTVSHRRTKPDPFENPANELKVGATFVGTVVKADTTGAHVRLLKCIDGWIYSPNLHGAKPPSLGDAVNVKVIQIDKENRRVSLTLQDTSQYTHYLLPHVRYSDDAWAQALEHYPLEVIVEGQICQIFTYGAKIAFPDGVVGLLHCKEFTWERNNTLISASLTVGQIMKLKVIGTNSIKRRLELSLRQCSTHPMDDPELCPIVGLSYCGTITNVADYGVFVRISDGIEGLLHKNLLLPGQLYEAGNPLRVSVIGIESQLRRVALALTLE